MAYCTEQGLSDRVTAGILAGFVPETGADRARVLAAYAPHASAQVDAAFAIRYLETQDRRACLRFASAVSALKCRQLGGRAGIPTRPQAEAFLAQHPDTP